ncbi:MAG: hypothetical protein ABI878_14270 [Acidobacteriota bacterium]
MPKRSLTLLFLMAAIGSAAYLLRDGGSSAKHRTSELLISRPQFFGAAAAGVSRNLVEIVGSRKMKVASRQIKLTTEIRDNSIERSASFRPTHKSQKTDTALAAISDVPMPAAGLSFDGLSNFDNLAAFNVFFLPPDPVGDVGPNSYVQAVNSLFKIYNKKGDPVTPPFKLSDIMASLGTPCSTRDDGEPTVLYDPLADRWILSEYCNNFPPFRQMIAVSKTEDPAGPYFTYEFGMPNVRLNDFAKFGVWADGYYVSTEEYLGSDYAGSGVFAFDRAKMLVGDPSAGFIYFSIPGAAADRRGGFLPSDIDGLTPPQLGKPNTFASYSADEYGDANDALRLFDFRADFDRPDRSTFAERPESPLPVTAFDPTSPAGRADISPPVPGLALDSNSDRLMSRVSYRNFGSHESLVLNQTVRTTPQTAPYRAGVRVYRLHRTADEYSVDEQSTIGDPESSRWIATAAEDGNGNLAVGYNFASGEKVPSILYSGKLATDPAGVFRSEGTLVNGTGVQTAFGFRWGDWSSMSVDPVDDCTFWTTGEYFTAASQGFSDFTWLTRIGNFKFPECTPADRARLTVKVIGNSTETGLENVPVNISPSDLSPYFRSTRSDGKTDAMTIPPGAYTVTADVPGFHRGIVQAEIAAGSDSVVTVPLQPSPVVVNSGFSLTAESCSIDHAVEPGETLTINASFRNVGRIVTRDLRIALLSGGGITTSDVPRHFWILPVNGGGVTRPFTFTVSPDLACGSLVTLTFSVTDGRDRFSDIHIQIPSGTARNAFSETFDLASPALPPGWATAASGGQMNWQSSTVRSQSPPNSAFSPDPNQVGVNELVSPAFSITSDNAVLSFRNFYDLESTFLRNRLFDGGVLDIRIGGGDWQDIIAAGGEFESGGYDGLIDNCCQNPLAGRMGWSGTSNGSRPAEWITTRVKLPPTAAGQTVQLRWRVGTDIGTFREGQYIDDVLVTDGFSCSCSQLTKSDQ